MTKVIIVDDEPLARERLKRLLLDTHYEVCAEAAGGDEALERIRLHSPDIVLLDIRMPGKDGLEVAAELAQHPQPPAVIFTTAYDEYAIQAFRVRAQDYLLKPIRREDLMRALQNVTQVNRAQLQSLKQEINGQDEAPAVVCRSSRGMERIKISDVLYLQAEHKYVTVFHTQGETLSDQPLKELEQALHPHFLRIHRNTLINRHYIEILQRRHDGHYEVRLRGVREALPVSRRLVTEVKQFLAQPT
ncbi:LytTR family DNA-binding domain-containing protein [Hahella aquimaris]|uniref:LytR/AlgR family response regulator transcription factor n=1 Tax=Hahella sp. HNIBRBA332 TaxID=3015983 RepID=UPI00273BC716|nr:LytTR family DNA-binding domain-containing protein [Hahella sp. HNIBRBA332]WLQ12793.1 LytTR family DNA-binding domain-containing protein [Hahella sp. HNIBRBA332]